MSMTRFTDEENKIMNSLFILVMAIYGAFDNGGRGEGFVQYLIYFNLWHANGDETWMSVYVCR